MKNKFRKSFLAAVAIIALNATACQQVSSTTKEEIYSTTPVYYCDRASDGTPTTFGRNPRGPLALIRWKSDFFTGAGYTPERRCEEVSANFEKYRREGILNYITTGKENNQRVICVSRDYGGRCQGTLWTLKKDDDASELLHQLFQVGHLSRSPIDQSSKDGSSQSSDGSSQFYIDIDEILRKAAEKQ